MADQKVGVAADRWLPRTSTAAKKQIGPRLDQRSRPQPRRRAPRARRSVRRRRADRQHLSYLAPRVLPNLRDEVTGQRSARVEPRHRIELTACCTRRLNHRQRQCQQRSGARLVDAGRRCPWRRPGPSRPTISSTRAAPPVPHRRRTTAGTASPRALAYVAADQGGFLRWRRRDQAGRRLRASNGTPMAPTPALALAAFVGPAGVRRDGHPPPYCSSLRDDAYAAGQRR